MSNDLMNWHVIHGEPCGEDVTVLDVADWIGSLLLEDEGYVICAETSPHSDETVILEQCLEGSSLEEAKEKAKRFKKSNPRIGKVIFPFDGE